MAAATDFDRARSAARAAEAEVMRGGTLGALHGLPLGVKDLQDTAGLLTTSGNIGRRNHVPAQDNALVARLRAAGAIVTAKTNVPDMAAGANTRNPVWGATGNPFNPALNVAGLQRPGRPRCPVLHAGIERLAAGSGGLRTLRIGYTEDFGICAVDASIRRTLRDRVAALVRLGAQCEPITLSLGDADRVFDILRAERFFAGYAETLANAPETLAPHVRANIEMAASMTLADRAWAHLAQTRLARQFAQAFERFDLVVAPTSPVSPFPWTELYAREIDGQAMRNYCQWLALTYVSTLATNPALALPTGLDEAGMPFGLQCIGPLRGDARLLAMAAALEQAFDADPRLRRPKPDLAALQTARPALRSIVTHPPGQGEGAVGATPTAV